MENDIRKKIYLKLFYSILDWEWYTDTNTFRVFMHLLLTANRKDKPYMGDTIHRGEVLASLEFISKNTGLSIQNVRTAIKNLKSTGEITQRKIGKNAVYTIVTYSKWQSGNTIPGNELTMNQQRANNELTAPIYCNNEENDIMKECVQKTHTHGALNNVCLTDDEYNKFIKDYPDIADDVIEQLSAKIATGEKKYRTGHFGHLYVFARNYRKKPTLPTTGSPSYDINLAIERSLKLDPTKTKRDQI